MYRMYARIICLLLIGALLDPVGFAEEDIIGEVLAEEPVIVEESVEEPTEEPVEEPVEVVPEEPVEEVVEAVASEAVEAAVEEAADVELAEAAEPEAESVEEPQLESMEEAATEEPAAQAEAPAQEAVVEEADASAKLAEAAAGIPIDEAHFPDAAFRQYISQYIDGRGGAHDGALSDGEIAVVNELGLLGKGIKDLTGIKYFTNLQRLYVSGTGIGGTSSDDLITLDVSGMPNMVKVNCACNQLTALDFSNCPNLVEMKCYTNKLTSLVIAGCPKLENFECHNNKLTSLVFADNCPNLKRLWCGDNNLKVLDLSKQPEFVARWKSWKYKIKYKKYTWYAIRRSNPPEEFTHDNKTRIITASVPAVPAAFAEVPGAVAAQVTVAAGSTAKNTRATVVAAPGAKAQLNLGGATGKKFKSSNKKVAKVSKGGVITFRKGGKVKITYKVGKKTRKVTLTVTDPTMPTAVAFPAVNTAVKKGESVTLTPTVNEGANPGGYKWKSSNKKVATVKNGVVKFKKAGKVTITCTTKRGKKKASVTFAVSK